MRSRTHCGSGLTKGANMDAIKEALWILAEWGMVILFAIAGALGVAEVFGG